MNKQERAEHRIAIAKRMDDAIQAGVEPRDAARAIVAQIKAEGSSEEFLDTLGEDALLHFWGYVNRSSRPRTGAGRQLRVVPAADAEPEIEDNHHGAMLARPSVLDVLFKVRDAFKALGDMTRDDCLWLAEKYRTDALPFIARGEAFRRFSDRIRGQQTVRECYSEAEAKGLLMGAEILLPFEVVA